MKKLIVFIKMKMIMSKLERLKSLENIGVGDYFTVITPDFEDTIIQFIGRNPLIKNEEFSKKSGYFVEVYGKKRMFSLEDRDLTKEGYEFYIGYNSEFTLERRIELITDHYNTILTSLQDQLDNVKRLKSKIAE